MAEAAPDLLQLVFLSRTATAGSSAGWILILGRTSGEVSCLGSSVRWVLVLSFAKGKDLFRVGVDVAGRGSCLRRPLCKSSGCSFSASLICAREFLGLLVGGGVRTKSEGPIADGLFSSTSRSSPRCWVRLSVWFGKLGCLKFLCAERSSRERLRFSVQRWFSFAFAGLLLAVADPFWVTDFVGGAGFFLFQYYDEDGRCAPSEGCPAAQIARGLVECWWSSLSCGASSPTAAALGVVPRAGDLREDPRTVVPNSMFLRVLYAFCHLWRIGDVDLVVNVPSSRVPVVTVAVLI